MSDDESFIDKQYLKNQLIDFWERLYFKSKVRSQHCRAGVSKQFLESGWIRVVEKYNDQLWYGAGCK